MNNFKLRNLAPVVVRLGLAMVFLWFGSNQILNQEMWTSLIPEWVTSFTGFDAATIVTLNGMSEIALAVLLAFGMYIRVVATLLFIHLVMIINELGLSAIGVRDVGLAFAMLAVALHGYDKYSYDEEPM